MKVVVAHNRYRSELPSGENAIVDLEMAQLSAAGVTVLPYLRSSDEIPALPLVQKALLPVAPIWSSQKALSDLLEREKPDVLHLHNPYPLLSPWVIRTAHKHGVPVVQTVHNYRQVCAPGLYFRDGGICQDCRGKAFAFPAIKHNCYRDSKAQSIVMATTLALHRPTWRSVDKYIALTGAISDHLQDYGIPASHIVVKPNSVEDPGFSDEPGDGLLYAARMSPEKGLSVLLEAWQRHPVGSLGTLRLVGDGELRSSIPDRADIVYLGPMDRLGVREQIRRSAMVAVPSLWHDVLPTIILESLANGRPVLGSNLGGIPYLVDTAGVVVDPTPDAFAAALPAALAAAPSQREVARKRYEETFHPSVVLDQLLAIYTSLIMNI